MVIPLLQTKLYMPPLRPELVSRPRLLERFEMGLELKLTLVAAPAGYGKTTLVSQGVHNSKIPVGWLTLDEGDNDPTRFLAYFVAALQTIEGNLGQGLLSVLQSPVAVNVESILVTLVNEIAEFPDSLVLVLDDYHVIESQPVDRAITFLLDHLPPQMHLIIASRTDPALSLSRLRARGQMTELRASDLRFTADEAATFMNEVIGLNLSAEDITALETRTEGWITGLQLAALSMKGHDDISGFIESFTGSHHYVLDYLIDEVLQRRPKDTEDFLLQTSVLNRMSGTLCDAVTRQKNSQAVLEALEAANLFIVPLDNERRWYRYHHLFADLLRQRLYYQQPDSVAELHIRASSWYEENGLEVEALHHASAANDFERAARLVEGNGNPLYHRGAVIPVLKWLESLPPSLLDTKPSLCVMYAEVLMTRGRFSDAEEKYQAAETALQEVEQDAYTRDLLGRIANGRASLASAEHQPERTITLAHSALDLLHPDNRAIRSAVNFNLGLAYKLQDDRAAASQAFTEAIANSRTAGHSIVTMVATMQLGHMQTADNRLRQAFETYRHVLKLAGERPLPFIGEAHRGLAGIFYQWNDLDTAEHHAQQSIQLTRQMEYDELIPCKILLARLKLAQGDVDGAITILNEANQYAIQKHFASRIPEVAAAQVLALIQQGDLTAAADLAQVHNLPVSQARVYLAQGSAADALAVLEPLRRQAEAKNWEDERLKVMVLQTVALHMSGENDKAMHLLGEALALAEPEGFIRIFIDEGVPMAQLLYKVVAGGIMPEYTGKLLAAFEAEELRSTSKSRSSIPLSPQPLIEPLSQRELEVLELTAKGLSNRQISERLFLALSTVKGHNRNIFGKLGVKNRTQAVHKARALELLPPQ